MAKSCVFCGKVPESKTKEHVIPRWLIEATGDPKRAVTFGTYHWNSPKAKSFAFDQFTFPACDNCNRNFSKIEDQAKPIVCALLRRAAVGAGDFVILLDWLDKVLVGVWLGLLQLEGNPWGIQPRFHIQQRLGLHDRSVGIAWVEEREDGINLIGPESPCFGLVPSTMCLLINNLAIFERLHHRTV